MSDTKNILVGVDFSRFSLTALAQGAHLARRTGAKLHLVHVLDPDVVADLHEALRIPSESLLADFQKEARERIVHHMAEGDVRPQDVELRVPVGVPLQEILRAARAVAADLLVLGEKGAWEMSAGPGTLATQCVRKAEPPVLLVREPHRGAYRRVVACVDGSPTSARALHEAVRFARNDRAHLDVVYVFTPPWQALHYRAPTPEADPERRAQYREGLEAFLHQFLASQRNDLDAVHAVSHLVESVKPWAGIVGFLRNTGADLAVLGTRGRTGWKRLLMGTTAERVVRESPCSVLTVKPEGFAYDAG